MANGVLDDLLMTYEYFKMYTSFVNVLTILVKGDIIPPHLLSQISLYT